MKDKILTTPSKDTVKSLSVFVEKHLGHLVLYAPKILILGRHQNLPTTDQDNCCPPGCRAQAVGTDMHGITLQRRRPLSISVLSCRPHLSTAWPVCLTSHQRHQRAISPVGTKLAWTQEHGSVTRTCVPVPAVWRLFLVTQLPVVSVLHSVRIQYRQCWLL